jgi:predicted Rossmann fold nucleotide-binding protein DprA/Smf involved in DNA uptake
VIGSREFPQLWRVRNFIHSLPKSTIIVSGLARGVDSVARDAALKAGMNVIDVPANWDAQGKGAGFIRNRIIIQLSDEVVAFHDGQSKGTMNSIELAKKHDKDIKVILVDKTMSMDPKRAKLRGL